MSEHSMTLSWNDQASENTKRVRAHRVAVCSCGFERRGPQRLVETKAFRRVEAASLAAA